MSEQDRLGKHVFVGAIWRRKKTGALVRIAGLKNSGFAVPYYDISWETVESPKRRGASYQDYWFRNCEPVQAADAPTP